MQGGLQTLQEAGINSWDEEVKVTERNGKTIGMDE